MPQRNDWRFPLSFDLVPMLNVRRAVFRENLTREKIEWTHVESGFGFGMAGQASIGFLRQLDNMEMGLTASTRFGLLRGSANFPSPPMIALNVVMRFDLKSKK